MPNRNFRYRKSEREDGFTLIEILIVVLVIGILSSVSVPVFLNQRQVSTDAKVESDVKNIAVATETFFINNPDKQTITSSEFKALGARSDGVTLIWGGVREDFCIIGHHPNGKIYRNWNNGAPAGVRPYVLYQSNGGGTIDKTTSFSSLDCYRNTVG